jgi:hypothetical protein
MAFTFDLGVLHLQRRVAQNSVDPSVLAGAAYLERCPLAGTGLDPLDVAEDFAERNLGVGSNFASDDAIDPRIGSFHIENDAGEADWQTVYTRVDREQGYLFGRALGLISANVPAEAEATCGPISEGSVCPFWIEGDPDQEPVYDGDGNVVSAYGLEIGSVYGMKVNNDAEHYGAIRLPWASGVNAWRDFLAGGCAVGDNEINVCEGCEVPNEPGDYGGPMHQALEGGGPISDGLYGIEKDYGAEYPAPDLFPNAHLDCDLALTLDPDDSTVITEVRNYDSDGFPTGDPLTPEETIQAINEKTNPVDMAADGAPCGGLRQDGSVVPELIFESVQGRFMYIAMTDGECSNACDLPVLGILRMYVVCWSNQEDASGDTVPDDQLCQPNPGPGPQIPTSQVTVYGVFADFKAPNLLGGGGLGTNPLAPFHVVLVR